jgi:competence protein ComEC
LTGAAHSAVRAEVMVLCYLGGILLGRQRHLLNAMSLAGILLLIWDPSSLFDVSFQLSFMAVAFIALALSWWGREGHRIKQVLLVSCAAFLGTAPLVSYYFFQIPTIGVLSNLILLPFITLLMPLILLGFVGSLIHPGLGSVLFQLGSWGGSGLQALVNALSSWGEMSLWHHSFTFIEVCGIYGALLGGGWCFQQRHWRTFGGMLVIFLLLLWAPWKGLPPAQLEVTFLDVGQGDATLVRTPQGQTILIDAGGVYLSTPHSWDLGEKVLAPYLSRRGIDHLDLAIITHPDLDHYQGFQALVRHIPIKEFWISPFPSQQDFQYANLLDAIAKKNTPITSVHAGMTRIRGDLTLQVLSPPKGKRGGSTNNHSLVLKLIYKDVTVLMTGDIEASVEQRMAQDRSIKSDVLKVAHHGSRTSSTVRFLERVEPSHMVISVGRQNTFHLPHPTVVGRLEDLDRSIYRTDHHGAIIMTSNGKKIEFKKTLDFPRTRSATPRDD